MNEIREILIIPDIYKDCLTFNPILRLVEKHNSLIKKGLMDIEFKYIIETLLNIDLRNVELHPNWTIIECNGNDNENYFEYEDKNDYQWGFCICGHRIKNLNYISYIPTDITFKVGIDCVKKMGVPELYKKLQDLERIRKQRTRKKCKEQSQINYAYVRPSNPVSKWKINFGKYKGQTYQTLKNDASYVRWLLENKILEKCAEKNNSYNKIIEYLKDV